MTFWVTVKGRNLDKDVELFYVIEAEYDGEALMKAAGLLGVKMLDEVYSVNAVRSS